MMWWMRSEEAAAEARKAEGASCTPFTEVAAVYARGGVCFVSCPEVRGCPYLGGR